MIVLHRRVPMLRRNGVRDIPATPAPRGRRPARSSRSSSSGTVEILTCPPRQSRHRQPPIRVRRGRRPLNLDDSPISSFELGPSRSSPPNWNARPAPDWDRSPSTDRPARVRNRLPRRCGFGLTMDILRRRCLGIPLWVWIPMAV